MSKVDVSRLRKYNIILVLLALMGLFALTSPYFLTVRNLTNIITQNTYFIIVAVGLSFVMIAGGIDLSVGYQMSLVGVVTAMLIVVYRAPVWLAVVSGLLLGTLLGFINGLLVTRIRVFPLIVTLATSIIFQGVSYLISQARTFRTYPPEFLILTKGKVLGVPLDAILALMIVILANFVYSETVFGLRLVALGGNEEAARLSGINTKRMKIAVYTWCGFLVAVGTMVMIAKADTMNASFGPGTEFIALTAAIVGGVSFTGGEGNIPALVAGVFILAVIGNGMQLAGWGTYAQYVVRGCILLGAVAFDEYQRNARRGSRGPGYSRQTGATASAAGAQQR